MSELMTKLLARLTQILPSQDYHSTLEKFIESKKPLTGADVEHWEREYMYRGGQ